VQVFDTEHDYVADDHRRGVADAQGHLIPAGIAFGFHWRRDPDADPFPVGTPHDGAWWLRYHATSGDIYASRRTTCLPEQVWLIGRRFRNPLAAHALLSDLETHMHTPNSLLLAARHVHQHEPCGAEQ
jgi:hypothetical protein